MKICVIFAAMTAFFFITDVQAQQVPDQLKSMFPNSSDKSRQVTSAGKLTTEQRNFLWQGTKRDPGGYLRVSVSKDYIGQMDGLEHANDLEYPAALNRSSVLGMTFRGAKRESKYRVNYIFVGRAGENAMITAWRYKADGASINVISDFLNQTVDGMAATLSLATSEGSRACLWKIIASNDEILYEVVISDELVDQGRPRMTVPDVLAAVKTLLGFAKNAGESR